MFTHVGTFSKEISRLAPLGLSLGFANNLAKEQMGLSVL